MARAKAIGSEVAREATPEEKAYVGRKLKHVPERILNAFGSSHCYFYVYNGGIPRVYVSYKKLIEDFGDDYLEQLNTHYNCADIYVKETKDEKNR